MYQFSLVVLYLEPAVVVHVYQGECTPKMASRASLVARLPALGTSLVSFLY